MTEKKEVDCPKCGGNIFKLIKVYLSDRMLASERVDIICVKCGYKESLYNLGERN